LGYDICFCGSCGDKPEEIIEALALPPMVMPLTGLAIGKATEDPPIRPRLPTNMILHLEKYRTYSSEELNAGIEHMSEKLVAEGYYEKYSGRENYGWRDHMKNKFGGKWLNIIERRRWKALQNQQFVNLSDISLEQKDR
jgi:nitroreductase